MKKVLFSLLLAGASVGSVWAQSNTLLVYGNVGYDSQKTGGNTTNNYNFSPGVGYQWNDNWTGGINLGLSGTKPDASGSQPKTSIFSVGPFIRYTQPLAGVFAIYGQLNANYSSSKADVINIIGFGATLFPAIGVNLKNGFALNFTFGSLSYNSYEIRNVAYPGTGSSFHFAFGSGAGFGISKNFGLKK